MGMDIPPAMTDFERDDASTASEALGLDLVLDEPTPELVRELLREVIDPELGLDIVELGLLRAVAVEDGVARVRFTVTTPACPLSSYIEDEIRACLWQLPGLSDLEVDCEYEPAWSPDDMSEDAQIALGFAR
ncbi:MAG TPA: metal-sulfur cluster assembly factor [Solirubrobacteraceae bacterium]|nr:metal-sulfur cluster assembly factor [Solirubrobacteraceae bacterium]